MIHRSVRSSTISKGQRKGETSGLGAKQQRGCEEKGTLSYTTGGNANWYSHYGKQYGGSLEN